MRLAFCCLAKFLTTVGTHHPIIAGSGSAANARRRRRSFAGAEASNGASAISGSGTPKTVAKRRSGIRSMSPETIRSDDQNQRRRIARLHSDDAHPTDFDEPGDGRWSIGDNLVSFAPQQRLVVRNQPRTSVDQPQCQVGFARTGGAAQQDRLSVDGDRGGVLQQ